MPESYNNNITPANNEIMASEAPTIINTEVGAFDGQNKRPKCGSTDIILNPNNGKLRCTFCRHEFEPVKVEGLDGNINDLQGEIIGSGATNIISNDDRTKTLKCTSCGAE